MTVDTEKQKFIRQLKRMADDPVGLSAMGEFLGLELKANDDLRDKPIVAVLVPSYKNLHPNMLDARTRLLHYSKQFCTVYSEPIRGSSVVSWVRNDMLSLLYSQKKKFTHVLYIDDDMTFEPEVLVKMLRHQKDIVGAAYVTRSDPPTPNVHLVNIDTSEARRVLSWEQAGLNNEDGLISAKNERDTLTCGTGLVLYSREVLDRVGEMYVNYEYEKSLYDLSDEHVAKLKKNTKRAELCAKTGNRFWFQFLPRISGYGESGEDTSFCIKAAMCGFKTYVDTTIQPGHIGEYSYSYQDFLPYQKAEIEKAKANKLFF